MSARQEFQIGDRVRFCDGGIAVVETELGAQVLNNRALGFVDVQLVSRADGTTPDDPDEDLLTWMARQPEPEPAAWCFDCSVPIFREQGRPVKYVPLQDDHVTRELCDPCAGIRRMFGQPRRRRFRVVG